MLHDRIVPKPRPHWSLDDVNNNPNQYHLMTESIRDKALKSFDSDADRQMAHDIGGCSFLCLRDKYQSCSDVSYIHGFDRASIIISSSLKNLNHLYIGVDEKIKAGVFVGNVYDEDEAPSCYPKIGFLVCWGYGNRYAVKLNEFSAIIEVEEGNEYVFTFYSKEEDIYCALVLPELNNIEFVLNGGEVKVISSNDLQLIPTDNVEDDINAEQNLHSPAPDASVSDDISDEKGSELYDSGIEK